jgi:ORF6N domain
MSDDLTPDPQPPIPPGLIERRIHLIRGQKVMLDTDLADLYQVPTKALNQAVRRNPDRFPSDFMFQLSEEEASALRSQFVTLEKGRGRYSKYAPSAFTELGVAMLSSVLSSGHAVQMNILIMRAFVRLREAMATNKSLAEKIEKLERTQQQHGSILVAVVQDIQKLKNPPITRAIGFIARSPKKK